MRFLTPPGTAGVAVAVVPTAQRSEVIDLLRTPTGAAFPASWPGPKLGMLWLGGRAVDEVVVLDRPDGGLELHLHGSRAIDALLRQHGLLDESPPSLAPVQRLLLEALDTAQLDLALEQAAWDFDQWVAALAAAPAAARRAAAELALQRSKVALAMATPTRLVLVGRQNAGKSTLFNHLVARERVLVGPMPGLTRDPVVERTCLSGYPYEVFDTAGIGPAVDHLDRKAQQLGADLYDGALVVLVVDQASGPQHEDFLLAGRADLVVANKCDLPAAPWPDRLPRHLQLAAAQADAGSLRAALGTALRAHRGLMPAGAVGGPAALDQAQHAALLALLSMS